MADVGDMTYDADAVYINLKDNQIHFTRVPASTAAGDAGAGDGGGGGDSTGAHKPVKQAPQGIGEVMVRDLQDLQVSLDHRWAPCVLC